MKKTRLLREMFSVSEAGNMESQGLRVTGDDQSLDALVQALEFVGSRHPDADVADWADEAVKALQGGMGKGNATLPAFTATPGLDSFDDDTGPGPEEQEY
ncbi:MAG TPA: hypothetical protein VFT74_18890 [Isosphaeraceae bacterium]|nr:hypothetical protein [Isosphaeraceae bacterium]